MGNLLSKCVPHQIIKRKKRGKTNNTNTNLLSDVRGVLRVDSHEKSSDEESVQSNGERLNIFNYF